MSSLMLSLRLSELSVASAGGVWACTGLDAATTARIASRTAAASSGEAGLRALVTPLRRCRKGESGWTGRRAVRAWAKAALREIRLAVDSLLAMALDLLVLLARRHIAPGGINYKSFIGGQAGTDCLYSSGFTFRVARLRRTSSWPASSVKVTFTLIFLPITASVTV